MQEMIRRVILVNYRLIFYFYMEEKSSSALYLLHYPRLKYGHKSGKIRDLPYLFFLFFPQEYMAIHL
jgi:hypothetical protein